MPRDNKKRFEETSRLEKALWMGYNGLAFLVGITLTGLVANLIIYFFHATILGWGDSAPDWYINIQEWVMYGIFLGSATLWVGGAYWLRSKNRNRQDINKEA